MVGDMDAWCKKWNVPPAAVAELIAMIAGGVPHVPRGADAGESESAVQVRVRLAAARAGVVLWRNNVGAVGPVRYGLANDSPAVNARVKSSDLIGITPMTVTPEHVGRRVGLFTAVECKRGGWHYTGTKREVAQLRFLEIVRRLGGIGEFSTGGTATTRGGMFSVNDTARNSPTADAVPPVIFTEEV